jgi:Ni/Co efflux regulator RcnB
MNKTIFKGSGFLALLITGIFLSSAAFAEKPAWAGHGGEKKKHHEKYDRNDNDRHSSSDSNDLNVHVDVYFGDDDRVVIHDYYDERYSSGHCPPGLAKKRNGCMPPGQAKKWYKGRPLARDVIYHDLPHSVLIKLRLPPSGHKYVRVAADILLIAIGTGVVVDAIEDLGRI